MILKVSNLDFFLTWENYKKLHKKALFEKDDDSENYAFWLFNSMQQNSEEHKEKIELYIKTLKQISKESKKEFQKKWLNFELSEKEARDNCWNIINDFCYQKNDYYLRDNRTFEESLKSDYLGESYTEYPIGKTFSIILNSEKRTNWWSTPNIHRDMEIVINTDKVLGINGCFENFRILFDKLIITFENRKAIRITT